MSRLHWRVLLAAGASTSLLAGLAVDGSSAATVPETTEPATATTGTTATDGPAVEILPPDEPYGGATRGEWDARWWQWAVSMPVSVNPSLDPTGERCGYGQSGPVFFIPGNPGPATADGEMPHQRCVAPEGVAILLGPVAVECSTVEPPPYFGRNEEELRACAEGWLDGVTDLAVRINGQEVDGLDAYQTSSPLFTLNFPEDNLFGVEPGVAQAVAASYSFIIAPPPPGEYVIEATSRFADEPEPVTVSGTLIVEAPRLIEPETTVEAPPTT